MTINFAHRGYRAKYPENTLLAFKKAIEAGCGGIELDVQLSEDGKIVIIHDEDVRRTTNGSGRICDMSYAELKALDAGEGEKIPLLSEYFDMVKKLPIITNIELKNNVIPYEGLENKLLDMVRAYELSDRIIFSSFNHVSIKKMKKLAPDIPCGFICAGKVDANALAASARESGVEFIHPGLGILDDDFIDTMGRFNIPISVWTVNDEVDMKRLIKAGVYGVFTDDPELMARALQC